MKKKRLIIGAIAVILIAVILDQVVHLIQERRRTRSAGTTPQVPTGFPVVSSETQAAQK